ncbi:HAD-IC family P-type ATPase [Legionella dresdenensis]|uniref:HAD-IC family P-type ATPase n=1 Tax=Legionella dresdenensis TaxID=450200 RepID=A0ABV8CED7_9GAMM
MKKILFQDDFAVSGIMCFESCGKTIKSLLDSCISACIAEKLLPDDARLNMDAEPGGIGIHRLLISIESETDDFTPVENFNTILSERIRQDVIFEVIDTQEENHKSKSGKINWINITVNLIAMTAITILALAFPPSILLSVILITVSFLITAFTAREYLINFFRNLRTGKLANMTSTISLGWFLSLAHSLYHTISMPMASSFSMVFMNFIMPIILITCINGMDEIKRMVMEKSRKMQLNGLKTLFPQMSEKYRCYQLSQTDSKLLAEQMAIILQSGASSATDHSELIAKLLTANETQEEQKKLLREGMLIEVKPGECFPVDCILVHGNTIIDASILTGEPQQRKQRWQTIPAGAINLSQPVTVYATKSPYHSTVNSLLFRSNRAKNTAPAGSVPKFVYLYTALVAIGIITAILAPVAFGIVTLPLVLQNVIGILFSICPCTIAIAHQLPGLISLHHRNSKGIHLRDENLITNQTAEIKIIVFDKTGTLTTGNSVIDSSDIPASSPIWQRIYLLEKAYGREHPLAKAITRHYEENIGANIFFNEVKGGQIDSENRGLTAIVQEKVIQIGNADYLKNNNIIVPEIDQGKINQGFSAVYVAQDGQYQGVIYFKHEVRKGIREALSNLKREGKKIIMLTGDNSKSAEGFNQHIGEQFDIKDIHGDQTPKNKEDFLKLLMSDPQIKPGNIWFVGDGLNDAPCCRMVTEQGGVSCAMDTNDKSAFFTDICLNGSLDYLFQHNKLNRSLQQNTMQNKWIVTWGTIAFLAFILSFSVAGVAVSPLIPMAVMLATTMFILFNSYRIKLSIDNALDKVTSWPKKLLASNLSIGLLLGASVLLICGVLVTTIATGGLALPIAAFTAGAAAAVSSVCTLSAIGLSGAFLILLASSLVSARLARNKTQEILLPVKQQQDDLAKPVPVVVNDEGVKHNFDFFLGRFRRNRVTRDQPVVESVPGNLAI